MQLIKCVVRPDRLEIVRDALAEIGVHGLTVTDVRGQGRQKGHVSIYRGHEYRSRLLPKLEIELVVPEDLVDAVVNGVLEAGRTGEVGDGRVFVLPVEASYRIRTGDYER